MTRDYYREYIQAVDDILNRFTREVKETFPDAFYVGRASLERSVAILLSYWLLSNRNRDLYNIRRKAGFTKDVLCKQLKELLIDNYLPANTDLQTNGPVPPDISSHPYYELLAPYQGCHICYCYNYRQFNSMLPVLSLQKETTLVISGELIPDTIESGEQIVVLEMNDIPEEIRIQNDYLKESFPRLFYYANFFTTVLDILSPRTVLFLEGSHDSSAIFNALCRARGIPSFCLQQGWPSLIHSRFRHMEYDYYLTWGPAYNRLWETYNPVPRFIDTGYIYEVATNKTESGITFFLQAPVYITDETYANELLLFIRYCAETFRSRTIYVREHPEYKLSEKERSELDVYTNVRFVSEEPLKEVFARTGIAVAVFSSTLMEGVIHDAIPFVFDPGSNPTWYPDIETEGIGIITKSLQEAKDKMYLLLSGDRSEIILARIRSVRKQYCTAVSGQAVKNLLHFITMNIS